MKKLISIIILGLFCLGLSAQVNGELSEMEGKTIVKLWGTHYERGYAHGYLLNERIVTLFQQYIISTICYGSAGQYNAVRSTYTGSFTADERYVDEAQGVIDGISAQGSSLYNAVLNRDLDHTDILVVNTLIDLIYIPSNRFDYEPEDFGCSSLSSWGTSTAEDPLLNGGVLITRMLDWQSHAALINNPVLFVNFPDEEDEQNWISFGYPGFFNALSAINSAEVTCFLNMGNIHNNEMGQTFNPILLSLRKGVESWDYNNDGTNNPFDIAQAVIDNNQAIGTIIHSTGQAEDTIPAIVIENNNENGEFIRDWSDNTVIQGQNLALTNHFRMLYPPVNCYRYDNIADSLNHSALVGQNRSWKLLRSAAGIPTNLMYIQFNTVTDSVRWAAAAIGSPAYLNDYSSFNLHEILTFPTGLEEDQQPLVTATQVKAFPNPFNPTINFSIRADVNDLYEMYIYNMKGQKISALLNKETIPENGTITWNAAEYASGVYLYVLSGRNTEVSGKIVLMK